jgi:glycosyltransferase involved in cell wall biosynthesis
MNRLSIIIPFLNEGDEPINTLNNILSTADGSMLDIVMIDDASTDFLDGNRFKNYSNVTYIRNNKRMGIGYCQYLALNHIASPNVFMIDAHMRFLNDGWVDKIVAELDKDGSMLMCIKSLAVDRDKKDEWDINADINSIVGHHTGANLIPYYHLSDGFVVLFDPRWKELDSNGGDIYNVPCVMGACYAAKADWLRYIRGTDGLTMWGSNEEYLSLKTWLAGGSVRLLTTTGVGHIYRNGVIPYTTDYNYVLYNKLFMVYVLFDDTVVYKLFSMVRGDIRYARAFEMLAENIIEAKQHREYYKSIFVRDYNFLKTIGIDLDDSVYDKIVGMKEQIFELEKERDMVMNTLEKYEILLSELTNTNPENLPEYIVNNMIRRITVEDMPNNQKRVNNVIESIKRIQEDIYKLVPRSVFGFDV